MALPANYKQIAVGSPSGPSTPTPGGGSRSRSTGGGGGSDRNKDTTPIFTHSNYGNPAFTPQKAGKSTSSKNQSESRAPKPPKAPEKPALPYMRYSKRVWDSVKAQYPDLKLWELGRKIGAMWKQLNESEKQEFIDEYETDKVEYEKALKAYHNSPAYQAYLSAKSKLKSDVDVHETPTRATGKGHQERRIDIQPGEDEDDQDEGFTFKHVAYARYIRNHRLINEIFSDAVVPDVRSVVTTHRMQVLKRQVSSLTMHQTKLEAELQQMEEKFDAKKRRMMESSEAFQEELKRHCKPAVDDDTFQKMVHKMYEEMKKDRQRMEEPMLGTGGSAGAAGAHRVEEKAANPTGPVAAAPSAASSSAAGFQANDKKLTESPQTPGKPLVEVSSKTEPEPMDIEPPQKPSVPLPPKSAESRLIDPLKTQKPANEMSKDATKPPVPSSAAPVKAQPPPGKVPTPSPTPTPTPPPSQPPSSETSAVVAPPPSTPPTVAQPPQVSTQLPQQQQVPPSMPMHPHHAPGPHPHLPPHMTPHQPMTGMPPHSAYGGYGAPGGPTRSPYYQPQYGAHPSQPYGQYAPYPHYQQPYGPPPGSHYMNARPPPQHNGAPGVHYAEHGTPVPGQPPQPPAQGHMPGHDVYGQPPHNPLPPQQQAIPATGPPQAQPPPPPQAVPPSAPPTAAAPSSAPALPEAPKSEGGDKKEGE